MLRSSGELRPSSFLFSAPATPEAYTLSLHDAFRSQRKQLETLANQLGLAHRVTFHGRTSDEELRALLSRASVFTIASRSEEHTSELQSRRDLVCRLLLEKKIFRTDPFLVRLSGRTCCVHQENYARAVFCLVRPRPPRPTLFPYTTPSDLSASSSRPSRTSSVSPTA